MKKLRFQPTFASLTEAELEQLAHDVQRETYDAVRERVCKPRSEGGLDLHFTSNSPLVRLHNKKNRLDLINAQITSGQKLTLAQLDTITTGEHRAPSGQSGSDIHDAIMSATYLLVTEHDNTPHQLLALQRLADFPARAELREQSAQDLSRLRKQSLAHRSERMQITRAREARAQAKAQRAAEMHTHKIALDLRKQTHKENTTDFNQDLALAKLRLKPNPFSSDDDFASDDSFSEETQHLDRPTSNSRDAIPNNAATPAHQNDNIQNPVHPVDPVENPSSPSASSASSASQFQSPSFPSRPSVKSFLSPEVIANNNLYDQKIDTGEIRLIFTPGKHYEIEYCNPADQPALERMHKSAPLRFFEDPTRTHYLPGLRTFGKNPYIPPQPDIHAPSPQEDTP
jgi:hypothetical protein